MSGKPSKRLIILAAYLCLGSASAGEVLDHISDENLPAVMPSAGAGKNNDRRITYRVICSPEGEALPDCQQPPIDDSDSNESTAELPTPDFPPEPEIADDEMPVATAKSASQAKPRQLSKSSKKSNKPATNKKAAMQKKTASSKKIPAKKAAAKKSSSRTGK